MLPAGTRLEAYEILLPIGEGGMGVVYRARDTRLKRDVAVKVLPDGVSHDPQRLTRFQREAEVLASLNHPNIAAVYGWAQAGDVTGIVLELVEGPTLDHRIAQGPMSVNEVLLVAKQIADGVEAAHELGIIHRDLKPANIKVRADSAVKILDFGLAKAVEPAVVALSRGSMSPTVTTPAMTAAGVVMGTAAYMAPEQAAGKAVDRRADIWAFGVVLWEMLAGRRLFDGETVTHTLADVLRAPIDFDAVPPGTPRAVRELLKRCLDRDVRTRLRDIGEARIAIHNCLSNPGAEPATAVLPPAARGSSVGWAVAAVLALACVGLAVMRVRDTPAERRRAIHVSLPLPGNTAPGFFASSPDGRSVVMSYQGALAVRSLDSGELRPLTGARGARTPFWSHDGKTVAFFADRKLKTIAASGGPPRTLCDDVGTGAGGTWNRAGDIVFSTEAGALTRVAATGGACAVMMAPGSSQRRIPVFLPDGDHFLYVKDAPEEDQRGLYVGSLGDPNGRRLLPDASSALFVPNAPGSSQGHLVFLREQNLMAEAFEATTLRLSGEPTVVANHVSFNFTPFQIAASADANGTLMYLTNGRPERQLIWLSRSGTEIGRAALIGPVLGASVSLAPDGKRVAFRRTDAQGQSSLWVQDFERNQETRITSPPLNPGAAVWSPDGQRVIFGVASPGMGPVYVKSVNGGKEEPILPGPGSLAAGDWSRDGRWLVYTENNPKTGADIWLLADPSHPSADRKPVPLLHGPASESQPQISPDGKWLAYASNESGTSQVYLRALTGPVLGDTTQQVSSISGGEPRWRADGRELFYLEANLTGKYRLFSVPIGAAPNPAGAPKLLFEFQAIGTLPQANVFVYAASPDGQRFLINGFATDAEPSLEVILNWAPRLAE